MDSFKKNYLVNQCTTYRSRVVYPRRHHTTCSMIKLSLSIMFDFFFFYLCYTFLYVNIYINCNIILFDITSLSNIKKVIYDNTKFEK